MKTYLSVFLGSMFISLAVTPAVIWLAKRLNAVDRPGVRTVHTRPVPRIGGVAIFTSAMALIVAVLFLNNAIGQAFAGIRLQVMTLLCSASFVFVIGLIDDLKGLPARSKFLAELLAACSLCLAGVRISSIGITEQWTLHFGLLSWPLTLLWIVGVTNAVNLSDGLDGLAAGISAIACAVIAVFAVRSGQVVMAVLMLALLGSLIGFLYSNFNPAKTFMGDCGSIFLGFILASSGVLCSMKSPVLVGIALPVLVLGVPIFDTLFSMLRRFLERRSLFAPDRKHFHHRLLDLGLRPRHVVLIIYGITLLSAGLGMFMIVTRDGGSLLIFVSVLLLLLLVFHVVGSVRLKEAIAGLRRRQAIMRQEQREIQRFEDGQLYFYNARTHDQWWSAVCKVAERMDFAWLSVTTTKPDGSADTQVWRMTDSQPDLSKLFIMTITVNGNGSKATHEFEIAICVNGSYESAGRRAMLFSRLIDDHALTCKLSTG